jgi:putative photosynthetic complex assembly protein 2
VQFYVEPAAYALFIWWFSTGVIILLDNLPRWTFKWSMLAGTAVALTSLWRLWAGSADVSTSGAYAAFTYGLLVWGWHEMSFFMGYVTGPRRQACPSDATGWRRFGYGVAACLHHELAILLTAALVVAATWHAPNQVGLWTFMVLWGARQSAKLNVFLGVLNLNEQFVPPHLKFLSSYMSVKPMNLLFPFCVSLGTVLVTWLAARAVAPGVTAFQAAGLTVVATMLALAVIEHWFLVLPLPFARLWEWALTLRRPRAAPIQFPARFVASTTTAAQ